MIADLGALARHEGQRDAAAGGVADGPAGRPHPADVPHEEPVGLAAAREGRGRERREGALLASQPH
jgi:hypothetical protein